MAPASGSDKEAPSPVPSDSDTLDSATPDPGPPYSVFKGGTRTFIVTIITIGSLASPMTANLYFPALPTIAADLGVSIGLINLTLTTYMITQGLAPTFFGDFGDTAGRRPAFIISFAIYICANVGLALQDSYPALLVLRMIQGAGSSGTLALCFAVIADISVSGERGKFMGILGAGINVGTAMSPVLGGILAEYLGWRAIFWFCLIFSVAWLVPFILAVPETSRKVVGNGSIPPTKWNMTLVDYVRFRRHPPPGDQPPRRKIRFPNPINSLKVLCEKDLAIVISYATILYLVFILICATISTEFADIYSLSDLEIGLCYLPYGFGCCCAAVFQGYVIDWNYRRTARRVGLTIDYHRGDDLSSFPIEEARVQPVYPAIVIGVASAVAYGWVLQAETHLAGPLVLLFVIGLTITGSFSILNSLVVDLYPEAPATAVAAMNLFRCFFGAAGTAFIEPMLRAMGRGWTYTFWALVILLFSPLLWLLCRIGPRCRAERRARFEEKEQAKRALEEGSGG